MAMLDIEHLGKFCGSITTAATSKNLSLQKKMLLVEEFEKMRNSLPDFMFNTVSACRDRVAELLDSKDEYDQFRGALAILSTISQLLTTFCTGYTCEGEVITYKRDKTDRALFEAGMARTFSFNPSAETISTRRKTM